MTGVSRTGEDFDVDAEILGKAFGIDPSTVPGLLRRGEITSICETGMDENAGRWRLTFYHAGRALRLTVDAEGAILSRAMFASHPPQAGAG